MRSGWAALCPLALGGCVFEPVALEEKGCPCAPGWYCDRPSDRCIRGSPPWDAGPDGFVEPVDGAPRRDGGRDAAGAGDVDAGAELDAGPGELDAGPTETDAGPTGVDAGPPATECGGTHAGALFCDGFEDGTTDAWYNTWERDGTYGVVTDRAYRGSYSFLAHSMLASGRAIANTNVIDPTTSGHIYARGWFYIESVSTVHDISILQIGEQESPWAHASISAVGGGTQLFLNTTSPSTTRLGAAVPTDDWFCLELHVEVSATAGATALVLR